jgi:Sulfotransferase family
VARPLVLYVTGWCRSGTTLIGNLLGEVDGVVHVGELRYLWRNGVLGTGTNSTCGCGLPVTECALWRGVLKRLTDGDLRAAATAWAEAQERVVRTRHTLVRLAEGIPGVPTKPAAAALTERMTALYDAIGEVFGARVVVDSSKFPAEAAMLASSGAIDVRVLHVVRDPRATAHSWLRPKNYIPAMDPIRSTRYWTAFNLASELVGLRCGERALRLRYEDFVRDPRAATAAILRLLDIADEPPVDAAGVTHLGVNHTVTGNPDRLRQGPTVIRPDDRWRRELDRRTAAKVTALALPLLPRYGYPLRARGGAG